MWICVLSDSLVRLGYRFSLQDMAWVKNLYRIYIPPRSPIAFVFLHILAQMTTSLTHSHTHTRFCFLYILAQMTTSLTHSLTHTHILWFGIDVQITQIHTHYEKIRWVCLNNHGCRFCINYDAWHHNIIPWTFLRCEKKWPALW